jgi:hypothetical protein
MRTSLVDAPGTLTVGASESHRNRGKTLIRAALHLVCWIPFITTAADSWRGPWRAVGDNAHLALESWNTLSGWIPLIGQPNELPGAPHDLGPLQYWLLTVPVHIDPSRGVLWGAVLLAMLAVSLTIEAGYSVLGETGGLVAAGVVIAIVTWFPGFATRPEDNPNFGMIFFIATLSIGLAVLSGHRRWWPVLVVTASIAAQAHLTYAAASVGLVLIAGVTGLVDQLRAKGSYSWLVAGLIAAAACWLAPLEQEFAKPDGNMSMLLSGESREAQHVGFAFALKVIASLATPSPLWWQQNITQRHDLFQLLGLKPAALGIAILVITAASLVVAVWWLRSRQLAGLAGISLLVGVTAVTGFALVPVPVSALPTQQHDLVFAMFVAVLLAWLTVICVVVVVAVRLINDRRGRAAATGGREPGEQRPARTYLIPLPARAVAALLLVAAVGFSAVQQAAHYAGAGTNSLHVGSALAVIERSLPRRPEFALTVSSPRGSNRFQVLGGLCWALTANGYDPETFHPETTGKLRTVTLKEIAVVLRGPRMTVATVRLHQTSRGRWGSCTGHQTN